MGHRCTEYRVTIYADAISAFPKCTGMIPLTKAAWMGRKNNNSGLCSNFLHRHMTFRISSVSQNRILAAAPCTYGRAAERQAGEPPRLEADLGRPWEPIPTQTRRASRSPGQAATHQEECAVRPPEHGRLVAAGRRGVGKVGVGRGRGRVGQRRHGQALGQHLPQAPAVAQDVPGVHRSLASRTSLLQPARAPHPKPFAKSSQSSHRPLSVARSLTPTEGETGHRRQHHDTSRLHARPATLWLDLPPTLPQHARDPGVLRLAAPPARHLPAGVTLCPDSHTVTRKRGGRRTPPSRL